MIRVSKYILSGAAAAVGVGYAYKHTATTSTTNIGGDLISNLSPDHQYIHRTINKHAATWALPNYEIHSNVVSSNDPVEDRHVLSTVGNKTLISVIDGHAGWQCSELLSKCLHNYVARHILGTDPKSGLVKAYNEIDADLIGLAPTLINRDDINTPTVQEMLMPAMAGAVLVTAVVDKDVVHVAHAGDCRAVIGRSRGNRSFEAVPLTVDHDATNPQEVARVKSEHPGEEAAVTAHDRILGGLQPFRSMGDARYKWPMSIQEWVGKVFTTSDYPYKHLPRNFKTPPYVTANPDVTSYTLDDHDEFLVLATDGLWERVTNDQVIDMVGEYVSQVEKGAWVHEDHNCASHVIRNAFGGGDTDLVSSLLKIPAPQSRRFRDDITVVVVFLKPRKHPLSTETQNVPHKVNMAQSKITPTVLGLELTPPLPTSKL